MTDFLEVVVVDDQALVRTGFGMILNAEPDLAVVAEASDGEEAVRAVREHRPDVVLMDVRMPGTDGIEATRRIAALDVPTKVLILTTFDLDEYVYDALEAGASGFLLKDTPPEELVAAVRVIARGEALLAPSVTKRLIAHLHDSDAGPRRGEPDPRLAELTTREVEVLERIARGMSNAEIAADLYVGETTVKTHVGHVLAKLGVRDRVQAVVFAYESGLIRPGS